MVDRDLILRKLATLDTYLTQLAPYRDLDRAAYRDDWRTQRIVERTLHLAIDTCMDVADHIVADRKLAVPDTAAATFESLADAELLPRALAESLARMAETSSCTTMRSSIPRSCCASCRQTCRTWSAFALPS